MVCYQGRTSRIHPDAGQTTWTYDLASNLTNMATANLIAQSIDINYIYDYGQLTAIVYPVNTENNVYYEYGQSGFETGRISKSQDASGVHAYDYGNMGELTSKTTTGFVPVNGGEHYTFTTRWLYDSWNRVQRIEYPDGEVVEYDYDRGGQFVSMIGSKATTQSYVNRVEYDEFGSRTLFEYGNGVISEYVYNPTNRRLQQLFTNSGGGALHNLSYTYDPVGNITRIQNMAAGANGLGGTFQYNYTYDSLYRLTASHGDFGADAVAYELAMSYSPSGNILLKTLNATKSLLGNGMSVNYANEYQYSGPHTLQSVYDLNGTQGNLDFSYDGSGNMIFQTSFDQNQGLVHRNLCWDEENRLAATRDNNYITANIYDAAGNRAWKLAGEMNYMWQNGTGWVPYGDLNLRTWYPSEVMTVSDLGYTKHYFIEGQRIASRLGEAFVGEMAGTVKGDPLEAIYRSLPELPDLAVDRLVRDFDCLGADYRHFYPGETYLDGLERALTTEEYTENELYFYHSDHLGSSSFITDINGDASQHLQYLPFGEDFVHQQNTAAYYTPYTFSGKERDMETGLSYFGARYYDAGLSVWLSVDPMSDERLWLSPYNYCQWNPIKLIDPTGLLDQESENLGNGPGNPSNQTPSPKVQPQQGTTQLPSSTQNVPAQQDNTLIVPSQVEPSNQQIKPVTPSLGGISTLAEVTGLVTNKDGFVKVANLMSASELLANLMAGNYDEAAINLIAARMGPTFTLGELFVAASETKPVLNRTVMVARQNRMQAAFMYNLSGGKSKVWEAQLNQAILTERATLTKLNSIK